MKNNLAASEVHTRCELKVGHGWFYSPLPIDIQSTDIMLVLPEYPRRAHMHHALSDERLEGHKAVDGFPMTKRLPQLAALALTARGVDALTLLHRNAHLMLLCARCQGQDQHRGNRADLCAQERS